MPAMWIAGAAVLGSVISGSMASDAAGDAADAQVNASGMSTAEQRRQYDVTRRDNAPFLKTGTAANKRLAQLLGLPQDKSQFISGYSTNLAAVDPNNFDEQGYLRANPDVAASQYKDNPFQHYVDWGKNEGRQAYAPIYDSAAMDAANAPGGDTGSLLRKFGIADLEADPVYQSGFKFGLDRGTEGINSRAMAGGMYDSGATLKALTQFGNDYGSTKANESYNRDTNDKNNIFNRLSGISGSGQVATNQIGAAGTNMANNVSATLEGAGNSRAAAIVGGGNAWGNTMQNANGIYNNYRSNERLDALVAQRGGQSNAAYAPWMNGGSYNPDN